MEAEIKGVLGIENAKFEIGKTLYIEGANSAGKTSALLALAVLMSRNANPAKLPSTKLDLYRHQGASEAVARITGEGEAADGAVGEWEVNWHPQKGISYAGDCDPPAACNAYAVGLKDPLQMLQKDWQAVFAGNLPTEEAIRRSLIADAGVPEESDRAAIYSGMAAAVLHDIAELTMVGAAAKYDEEKKAGGRNWEAVVAEDGQHEKYGTKKAANWVPQDWDPLLRKVSESTLKSEMAEAQEALRKATSAKGYDEGQIRLLREGEAQIPKIEAQIKEYTGDKERLERDYACVNNLQVDLAKFQRKAQAEDDALAKLEKMPLHMHAQFTCPKCGAGLHMVDNGDGEELVEEPSKEKLQALREAELAEARKCQDAAMKAYAKARRGLAKEIKDRGYDSFGEIEENLGECKGALHSLRHDRQRIKGNLERAASMEKLAGEATEGDLAEAENKVAAANRRHKAWSLWHKANSAHEQYIRCQVIANSISKGAISIEMSRKGMSRIQKVIQGVGNKLGYPVEIDRKGTLTCAGRTALLCAENERWAMRIAAQAALGHITGSRVALVDKCDVLDKKRHAGLVELMKFWRDNKQLKMSLICFGTTNGRESVLVSNGIPVVTIAAGKTV